MKKMMVGLLIFLNCSILYAAENYVYIVSGQSKSKAVTGLVTCKPDGTAAGSVDGKYATGHFVGQGVLGMKDSAGTFYELDIINVFTPESK